MCAVCGLGMCCLRGLEVVMPRSEEEDGNQGGRKESVVGQGMCFCDGMCKGPRDPGGGLVWEISIFLKKPPCLYIR